MRIAHCGPMHAVYGFALAQPQAYHIEVEVAQCPGEYFLVLCSPRHGSLEFRYPDEPDGALRTRYLSCFDQFVEGAGCLDECSRTGSVVICSQLHISFKEMCAEYYFPGIRVGAFDYACRHLYLRFLGSGLDIGLHRYLLSAEKTVPEGISVTRR